jgi:hypothetical protein
MVVRDRSFSSGSPVCRYWLTRCEGFTVRSGARTLGVVETVDLGDPLTGADAVVVRSKRRRRRVVPAQQVLAVVPARQLLLARRQPRLRRTRDVAVPATRSVRVAARAAARGLLVAAAALARAVEVAAPVVIAIAKVAAAFVWALARRLAGELRRSGSRLVRAARDQVRDRKRKRDLERDQQRERGEEQRESLPDRLLAAARRGRGEAPRAHLEQSVADLARRLRRLEQLPGRLPRRRQPDGVAAVDDRALEVRDSQLQDARALPDEYLFAIGHHRLDVGRKDQAASAVEQP